MGGPPPRSRPPQWSAPWSAASAWSSSWSSSSSSSTSTPSTTETGLGRQLKSLQQSYQQFGDKSQSKLKTLSSLELGKKISEKAKATKAKVKPPSNEFVNPHPMVNNNNVITASM